MKNQMKLLIFKVRGEEKMDKDEAIKWLDNISDNGWTKTSNAEAQSMCRTISKLLKSEPYIDKIVKELDDTSKQYEPRPFESINWVLRLEGIRIGLEIAQYVVKGEPIPDKF